MSEKLTMVNLSLSVETLKKIAALDLPINISFQLALVLESVDSELKIFGDLKTKLLSHYGVLDKEKNIYNISEEKRLKYATKYNELCNREIDIDLPSISLTTLTEEGLRLSTNEVRSVLWLIKEGNKTAKEEREKQDKRRKDLEKSLNLDVVKEVKSKTKNKTKTSVKPKSKVKIEAKSKNK